MQNLVSIFILSIFGVLGISTSALSQDRIEKDSLGLEIQVSDSVLKDTVSNSNAKQIDEIVSFAKKFLGTPYYYSGITPAGFDCSGFIYYVMGNFGLQLTHSSYGLAEFGKTVKLSELKPGDLMFFKGRNVNSTHIGHVGMVVEVSDNEILFIHASTSRGVVIDNFKTSKYYIPRFIKAKRLDYGEIQ
jgi:cell wall-associated NlpC family hydrolase